MSQFEDENSLTADDLLIVALAAASAASMTGCSHYITISNSAKLATDKAIKNATELTHLDAIKSHDVAWKIYRRAAKSINENHHHHHHHILEALSKHEKAIYIHQTLHSRFFRARHGVKQ